jgi:lipoprotein-anchoring transpeptidase ErfK/SrfK
MTRARPKRRVGLGFVALAGLVAGGALAIVQVATPAGTPTPRKALPPPPESVIHPKNVPLGKRPVAYWAPVLHAVAVRRAPRRAGAVAELAKRTPEGTANLVLAVRRGVRRARKLWVQIRVPGLPGNAEGWVPRSALGGYTSVHTRLIVDRARLRATLLRDGKRVFRAPVGIGTPSAPTPAGRFYVRNKLVRYSSPFYGPVAFGTSARSPALSDWPAGGFVGIHGTNQPDLLPGRVSHGCIRMANRDILRLSRLMPIGTPLTIR